MTKVPRSWRKKNKLRILAAVVLLAFLVPVFAVTVGNATHSTDKNHPSLEKGTISFTQTAIISGPTLRGEHTTISTIKENLAFTGNLSGTAMAVERQAKHNSTDEGVTITFTTFHGTGNFSGTLNGVSVTLHIRYEGIRNSTFTRGNFVVSGDTNQNADVHGEGHFRGTLTTNGEGGSPGVNYTMHSNVADHTDHPEAGDQDRDEE